MSAYLTRLKQLEGEKNSHYAPDGEPTKPSEAPFVGFDGTGAGHIEKKIIEQQQEARRLKVLAMLDADPALKRAIYADSDSDPDNVILAIAVRHVATCEMLISKSRFDPMRLLELIDAQTTH